LPRRCWLTVRRLEVALTQFEAWPRRWRLRCDDRAPAAHIHPRKVSARMAACVAGRDPPGASQAESAQAPFMPTTHFRRKPGRDSDACLSTAQLRTETYRQRWQSTSAVMIRYVVMAEEMPGIRGLLPGTIHGPT
jgi:hypothetical protein